MRETAISKRTQKVYQAKLLGRSCSLLNIAIEIRLSNSCSASATVTDVSGCASLFKTLNCQNLFSSAIHEALDISTVEKDRIELAKYKPL